MSDNFQKQLIAARTARNLSQEQLAKLVGASRQTVSQWENGHKVPDAQMMKSLAATLEIEAFAQADTATPEKKARTPWLALLCAFLGGIAVASLFFCLILPALTKSAKAPANDVTSWAWYQQPAPNIEGKPYLELEPDARTVKLTHSTDSNFAFEYFWRYGYFLEETNGFPLSVTKIVDSRFNANKEIVNSFETDIEFFRSNWGTPDISANDTKRMVAITPANDIIGMGIAVYATDSAGEEMIFPLYIAFSHEIDEHLVNTTEAYENDAFDTDGASLLSVTPMVNPVPLIETDYFVGGTGWHPTFIMKNVSDKPLYLKRIVQVCFLPDGKETLKTTFDEKAMASWFNSLRLEPNAEQDLTMGMNKQSVGFLGYSVFFQDADGKEYESRVLFTLAQE
jgi:Predicted transcriptional regulators